MLNSCGLNTKKKTDRAKILKGKFKLQPRNYRVDEFKMCPCNNNVVNINKHKNLDITTVIYKQGRVHKSNNEAKIQKIG